MLVTTKHYTSIGRYGSVWNNTLEQIIRNSDPRDRFNFLALNKERKGLGASGYGSILFSDLFDVSIPLNAALINSSLVYLCGIIDDDIDRPEVEESEAVEILNDFEDFLETGNGFSNLQPFRDFIIERYPQDDWKNLIGRLSDHKEAVIEEVMASSLEELKAARIRIGETYGHLVATIISAFAERNLTEQEREVLEAYSAGCTLMDDVADFFQDRRLKQKNPIEEGIKSGNETIRSLMDGWNEATIFFERGSESVKNKQRSDYNSIVTLTKLFYGSSLVKKFVASMLDSFLFTQYRAGLNNEPFKIFKLRTMREDNEISEPNSMSNGTKTVPDYQRVTKVGRFLRKYWISRCKFFTYALGFFFFDYLGFFASFLSLILIIKDNHP